MAPNLLLDTFLNVQFNTLQVLLEPALVSKKSSVRPDRAPGRQAGQNPPAPDVVQGAPVGYLVQGTEATGAQAVVAKLAHRDAGRVHSDITLVPIP